MVATGDRELAFEAADEAFARAYRDWARVAPMGAPRAWVYQVALNVARRTMRRRSMEQRLLGRAAPPAELPEEAGQVRELLAELPDRQRLAMTLRYVGDLTEEQIAAVMGVKRGTVSRTLREAHQRLSQDLALGPSKEDSHGRA